MMSLAVTTDNLEHGYWNTRYSNILRRNDFCVIYYGFVYKRKGINLPETKCLTLEKDLCTVCSKSLLSKRH